MFDHIPDTTLDHGTCGFSCGKKALQMGKLNDSHGIRSDKSPRKWGTNHQFHEDTVGYNAICSTIC